MTRRASAIAQMAMSVAAVFTTALIIRVFDEEAASALAPDRRAGCRAADRPRGDGCSRSRRVPACMARLREVCVGSRRAAAAQQNVGRLVRTIASDDAR